MCFARSGSDGQSRSVTGKRRAGQLSDAVGASGGWMGGPTGRPAAATKSGGSIIGGEQRHAVAAVIDVSVGYPAACSGAFRPRITVLPPRRFRASSGNRKCKRKCTQIRRDARKWHACAVIGLDQNQCRFSLHLRYSFLFACICVYTFLGRGRYPHARLAKNHSAEKRRRQEAVGMRKNARLARHRLVRTSTVVAGSSARKFAAACGDSSGR